MPRKSRTVAPPPSSRPKKRAQIPESFRIFSPATVSRDAKSLKVPMLVLCGEWLKTIGFPIGSAAYLISDKQGELALRRAGCACLGGFIFARRRIEYAAKAACTG